MTGTTTDPAADKVEPCDLDLLVGRKPGAPSEPRIAPGSLEPTAWLERRCPTCHEPYERPLETCPLDGQPLREVLVSRPFLWLG